MPNVSESLEHQSNLQETRNQTEFFIPRIEYRILVIWQKCYLIEFSYKILNTKKKGAAWQNKAAVTIVTAAMHRNRIS